MSFIEVNGEKSLHKIHQSILVGSIQSKGLDSRLGGKHAKRTNESLTQNLAQRPVWVIIFRAELLVACLALEFLFLDCQDPGRICLTKKQECKDLDQGIGHRNDPEHPSP